MSAAAARHPAQRVDLVIRPGREGDLDRVLAIERSAPTAPRWSRAAYAGAASQTQRRCLLVAERDGDVVGFAVAAALTDPAELESIVVDNAARGCGIGAALCGAVLAWSGARGVAGVELEVRAASLTARRVYERAGFREVARRPGYYAGPEDDAILMRAELPAPKPVEPV